MPYEVRETYSARLSEHLEYLGYKYIGKPIICIADKFGNIEKDEVNKAVRFSNPDLDCNEIIAYFGISETVKPTLKQIFLSSWPLKRKLVVVQPLKKFREPIYLGIGRG